MRQLLYPLNYQPRTDQATTTISFIILIFPQIQYFSTHILSNYGQNQIHDISPLVTTPLSPLHRHSLQRRLPHHPWHHGHPGLSFTRQLTYPNQTWIVWWWENIWHHSQVQKRPAVFRHRKRACQVLVAPWKHEEWVLRQHIGDEVDHSYWHTRWCTWTLPWSF